MEKIYDALAQIEAVLRAVDSFETSVSSGDFEKRFLTQWPDINRGLEAVSLIKIELQEIQKKSDKQITEGTKI